MARNETPKDIDHHKLAAMAESLLRYSLGNPQKLYRAILLLDNAIVMAEEEGDRQAAEKYDCMSYSQTHRLRLICPELIDRLIARQQKAKRKRMRNKSRSPD